MNIMNISSDLLEIVICFLRFPLHLDMKKVTSASKFQIRVQHNEKNRD